MITTRRMTYVENVLKIPFLAGRALGHPSIRDGHTEARENHDFERPALLS